jgi:putative membrane protein
MKKYLFRAAACAAVCAVAAATASGASNRPALDAHWLRAAAQGDVFEVTMGQLGLQKGTGTVCTVARMLVMDHTKALRQTRRVATQARISVPAKPNGLQQSLIQMLSQTSGTSFQQLFTTIGLGAHRYDIAEAKEIQRQGQLKAVRNLAGSLLPVLQRHLAQFVTLSKATNPASTAAGAGTSGTAGTTSTQATTTSATTTTTGTPAGAPSCAGTAGGSGTSGP